MDIILISHVRFLRDTLVVALQAVGADQACSAFSHETAEAAIVELTPSLVIVDAAHPKGTALVAAVRAQVH